VKEVFSVLVVDDSDDDRLFVRRAFRNNPAFVMLGELGDGEMAINYFEGQGEFADREKYPFPDVLLLDLKLPKKSGYEVLEWLREKGHDKLRVVILSGSFLPQDITRCQELGAHGYFKKEALAEEQQIMIADMEKMLRQSHTAQSAP